MYASIYVIYDLVLNQIAYHNFEIVDIFHNCFFTTKIPDHSYSTINLSNDIMSEKL